MLSPFQVTVGKHDAEAEVGVDRAWNATDSCNSAHSPITEGNTAAPEGGRTTRPEKLTSNTTLMSIYVLI